MRLTPKQTEFMDSIWDQNEVGCGGWECFRHELQTAISLEKKGLVSFQDNERPDNGCEYFTAQLTDAGKKFMGA